ncbi:unnamed protein product [Porites lobata]|uniref:Scavenger receptor class A member 5 n=1 Tax=Porites lobata TaxID=104759 RepID=A0ABN8PG78_9CNID|nr:unnamed protein product [Porites lobata]
MPYKIHPSRRTWTLEETKIPQRAWTLEETQIPHRPNSARRAPPRRDIRGALLVNPSFQRSNEPVLEENMEPQMMEAPMPRAPSGHHRVAIKRENINLVRECEWDVKSLKDENDGRIKTTLSKPLTLILGFVCLTSLASLLLTLLVVFGSVGTGNCPCARNKVAGSTGAMKSVDEERIVDVSGNLTSLDKKLEGKILEVEQRYDLKVKELLEELIELRLTIQQQKINAEEKEISQDKHVKNLTDSLASTQLELESLKAQLSWHVTGLWNTTNSTKTQLNHLKGVWIRVNATSKRISNLTKEVICRFEHVWQNMHASNETLNELVQSLQALKLQIKNESETVWFSFNKSTKSFVDLKSSLHSLKENVSDSLKKLEAKVRVEEKRLNETMHLKERHSKDLASLTMLMNRTRMDVMNMEARLWKSMNSTDKKGDNEIWVALNNTKRELQQKINNISKMAGPIGPPGFNGSLGPIGPRGFNGSQGFAGPPGFNGNQGPAGPKGSMGPPGPKGAGNFSACQYKTKTGTTGGGSSDVSDASVDEPRGSVIIAATCSTNYAAEYNLLSAMIPPRRYVCNCKGRSSQFHPGRGESKTCYLHYWLCPKT